MYRFLKNGFSAVIILIAGIVLSVWLPVFSQPKATIFPESIQTNGDTVDMGMSFNRVPINTNFNLKNLSGTTLSTTGFNPSWSIGYVPNYSYHENDFFYFLALNNNSLIKFPFDVLPNSTRQLTIQFKDTNDVFRDTSGTNNFTPYKKAIRLKIGLYDRIKYDLQDEKNYAIIKEYTIIARNTYHNIDVFENKIDYDSVFINPVDTLHKKLIVQNSSNDTLYIDSIKFARPFTSYITTDNHSMPIKLNPYLSDGLSYQKVLDFRYFPLGQGSDYDSVYIKYKPNPKNFPDSTETLKSVLVGVCVTQNLDIITIDSQSVNTRTIDFGDVNVGETVEKEIVVKLHGNLPLGVLSQKIKDIDSDIPAQDFSLTRKIIDTLHLQPSLTDTFKIRFTPSRSDSFRARLVLESDITKRKVWGYPDSVKNIVFYINGIGRQSEIAALPDTIDFGNIIINKGGECLGRRDSSIILSNIGNLLLKIKSIRTVTEYTPNPFKVNHDYLEIKGRSSDKLILTFDSVVTQTDTFYGKLYIISNSARGKDSIMVVLKARGILPDTMDISLPQNVIAMPGRRIAMPIMIDKNKISVSKIYIDTITYNKTILNYTGSIRLNTASELAETVDIKQDSVLGNLYIFIQTHGTERFLSHDTLIILQFDTYLGDNITSTLHFVNPKFGDGICSRVLSTNRIDGSFSLDSVCGLEFKVGPSGKTIFRLEMPSPNPSSDLIEVSFEMAFKTTAGIFIYNSFGELVKTIVNQELPGGIFRRSLNINDLSPGVYFITMQAGIFKDVRNLVITK